MAKTFFEKRMEIAAELPSVPTTLSRTTGERTQTLDEFLEHATTQQLKEYFEKRYPAGNPYGGDY